MSFGRKGQDQTKRDNGGQAKPASRVAAPSLKLPLFTAQMAASFAATGNAGHERSFPVQVANLLSVGWDLTSRPGTEFAAFFRFSEMSRRTGQERQEPAKQGRLRRDRDATSGPVRPTARKSRPKSAGSIPKPTESRPPVGHGILDPAARRAVRGGGSNPYGEAKAFGGVENRPKPLGGRFRSILVYSGPSDNTHYTNECKGRSKSVPSGGLKVYHPGFKNSPLSEGGQLSLTGCSRVPPCLL